MLPRSCYSCWRHSAGPLLWPGELADFINSENDNQPEAEVEAEALLEESRHWCLPEPADQPAMLSLVYIIFAKLPLPNG